MDRSRIVEGLVGAYGAPEQQGVVYFYLHHSWFLERYVQRANEVKNFVVYHSISG
jgi:hypothetical protein